MIYPQENRLMHWILGIYVRFVLKRHFYKINFNTVEVDKERSILLIANHFSIWDGLILYWVTHRLLTKKFHVMILEDTAKKEPMLKYGGAFSINKGARSILHSIDHAAQLLNDPQNLVLIFPQGKLHSNFVDEIRFEKGVMKIMDKAKDKFQLIFAATFIENLQHKKPTANVYLSSHTMGTFENIEALTHSYQQHYKAAKVLQTKIVS
jgi:1-acyl-sn-glycerol-3-phosphate acyltransferase